MTGKGEQGAGRTEMGTQSREKEKMRVGEEEIVRKPHRSVILNLFQDPPIGEGAEIIPIVIGMA